MKKNIQRNNEINITSLVFKTILKTIWIVLFSLGFVFLSMNIVAPRVVLDIYDFVGLDKPAYIVQKRLYLRDNTNENLYNLIQRAIEIDNYKDQTEFIMVMLENEDYMQFQEKIDSATKESLGDKYSIYADSYDSYLRRHLVGALYKTNDKEKAKELAIDSVEKGLYELHEYVALVDNDTGLNLEQKKSEVSSIAEESEVLLVLKNKQLELDESLILSSSSYDKIVIYNQKIKIAETQLRFAKYTGDSVLESNLKEDIKSWETQVKNLKQSLT